MSEVFNPHSVAGHYFDEAKKQWDEVILNNDMAKEGFAAAQIAGLDVVCYGIPGTGKTTFADRGHHTLGIPDEKVAYIETDPNITFEHLLGDISSFKETTEFDGEKTVRNVEFDSKAKITPDTEIIVADEINRLSPHGLNGLYKIMAERKAITRRGVVEFPNLQYLISTMNPGETRQATFKIPDALASRHVVGLPFGINQEDARATHVANFRGWTPGEVTPIDWMTPEKLGKLRLFTDARSEHNLQVNDSGSTYSLLEKLATTTQSMLRDEGINDGLERQGMQAGRVARALALIRGQMVIEDEKTIRDAYFYVTSARLGMLSVNGLQPVIELQKVITNA